MGFSNNDIMCMALFVAADEPLPVIEWRESAPAFNVQVISETEESVRRHFSKPHVYYLGAHTGCSCGFAYGRAAPSSKDAAGRASVAALQQYLRDAVQRLGEVELFSSWEGEWNQLPDQRLEVTGDWFGGDTFELPEKVAFRVTRSAVR